MMRVNILPTLRIISSRAIHSTVFNGVREVTARKAGKVTIVEGKILQSPREPYLIKPDKKIVQNACMLCRLNLDIKHTDVLILMQFVTREGEVLPRELIGICAKQYKRIRHLVAMAQEAGLLGNFINWNEKVDVSQREGFKKWNTYYDEKTIEGSDYENYDPKKVYIKTFKSRFDPRRD